MAHFTGNKSSNGSLLQKEQPQLRTPENKKSVRRNSNTKSNAVSSPDDMEIDADEEDSNTMEEQESSAEDPDASALSVVRNRLAGLRSSDEDDDVFAGAEQTDAEEDYAGLDEISSADEDEGEEENETDVLRKAEQDLIQEFERKEHRRTNDAALDNIFGTATNGGADDDSNSVVDMNEDPFAGLQAHDSLYLDLWNDAEYDLAEWRLPEGLENNLESNGNKKRVRFEEVRSRSSSVSSRSSVDANETFPDLFMASDDPALAQRFAIDADPDATFVGDYSDGESCYDFDGEEEMIAFELDEESDSEEDEDVSSDDTDEDGDTTDEETEEETIARMLELQKAAGKTPSVAPSTPATATKRSGLTRTLSNGSPVTPKNGKGPRTGTFILDPTRAAMSADASGTKIKLLPPTKPTEEDKAFWRRAKTAAFSRNSSPTASSGGFIMRPPSVKGMPERPFTAQSTLASMFNGNIDLIRNNDNPGVSTNMFPAPLSRPQTSFGSTTFTEDSELEPSDDIDMGDFIDMSSDSDSDQEAGLSTSPTKDDVFVTPRNDSFSSGLLDHLEQQRGLVGSFRRNQSQVKHVSSLASNPIKRAATMESSALQTGRRGAANTPMTPARKNRADQTAHLTGSGVKKAVASPLAQRRRSRGNSISGNSFLQNLSPSITR